MRGLSTGVLLLSMVIGCEAQDRILLYGGAGPAIGHALKDENNPNADNNGISATAAWSIGAAYVGWDTLANFGVQFGMEHLVQGYSVHYEQGGLGTGTVTEEDGRFGQLNLQGGVVFRVPRRVDLELGLTAGFPIWASATVHSTRTSMGTVTDSTYTRDDAWEHRPNFGVHAGLGVEWPLGSNYLLLTGVRVNQGLGAMSPEFRFNFTQALVRVGVIKEL